MIREHLHSPEHDHLEPARPRDDRERGGVEGGGNHGVGDGGAGRRVVGRRLERRQQRRDSAHRVARRARRTRRSGGGPGIRHRGRRTPCSTTWRPTTWVTTWSAGGHGTPPRRSANAVASSGPRRTAHRRDEVIDEVLARRRRSGGPPHVDRHVTVHSVRAHDEAIAAADVEHPHRERPPRLTAAEEARQRGESPAGVRDVVGAQPGDLELRRHGVIDGDHVARAVTDAVHADVAGVSDNRPVRRPNTPRRPRPRPARGRLAGRR